MKKIIIFLILITGITPVITEQGLTLSSYQVFSQPGIENQELEEAVVCDPTVKTTTDSFGDWTTTTSCSYYLDAAINDCVEDCDVQTSYDPQPDPNDGGACYPFPCDDPEDPYPGGAGGGSTGGGTGGTGGTTSNLSTELNYYQSSSALKFPAINVRIKAVSVTAIELARAPVQLSALQLTQLTGLTNLYNGMHSATAAVNSQTVQSENLGHVNNGTGVSANTNAFNSWFNDILFIQLSSIYNNITVPNCGYYGTSCNSSETENDDFVGFAQQNSFFVNNPDDPWRLKKFLSPDSYYTTGLAAGVGDGLIEAADTVYTLVKFSVKSNPVNLMTSIITDFEGTIQQTQDYLEMTKDLIDLIHDPVKRAQIVNAIESEMVNWYDQVMGNKTWAEMGYQHGKLLVEVAGALVGVTEIKLLLKTGQFSTVALSAIRKVEGLFAFGNKLKKVDGLSTLIDDAGRVISKGDENVMQFLKVKGMAKGSRPNPNTYLEADYISQHLSKFDEGVIRFTTESKITNYGSLGPSDAFTMPKSEFDLLMQETVGDLAEIEKKLGLNPGDLTSDDAVIAYIERIDLGEIKMPSGNESGIIERKWLPGGRTEGGYSEGIVDLSNPNIFYTRLNL